MEQRQNQDHNDLQYAHHEELNNFNALWDRKVSDYYQEGDKQIKDLQAKQKVEQVSHRNQLCYRSSCPSKLKRALSF